MQDQALGNMQGAQGLSIAISRVFAAGAATMRTSYRPLEHVVPMPFHQKRIEMVLYSICSITGHC